jgi:sugar lactone lactonase YvrE
MDYRTIRRAGPPFHYPTNLALAADGTMFITDGYGNARVHVFSPDGKLLRSWGEPGNGPGQFHLPHGIAIDRSGIVYVADRENSRIQLFTSAGEYLTSWTDVVRPCQVFVDRYDRFYVAELGRRAGLWSGMPAPDANTVGGRVSVFDRDGKLLARWGGGLNPCAPGDFFAPHDICVDSQGAIYVGEVTYSAGAKNGVVPLDCHSLQKFTAKL